MYRVVGSDGQVYGPVDLDTLKIWCQQGRVLADTQVQDPISGLMVRADQIPEIAALVLPRPVAGPPAMGLPPTNPYAMNPYLGSMTPFMGVSKCSRTTAAVLCFFLGWLGVHRFYIGHSGTGITQLLLLLMGPFTCSLTWMMLGLWNLADFLQILSGGLRDGDGRPLA